MRLEEIFAGFKERLPVELAVMGPDQADKQASPPRMIWVPTTTSYLPAKGISGGPGDEGMLAVREVTVRVSIWGRDLGETEALLEDFSNVVDILMSRPNYRLVSESWKTGGGESHGVDVELLVILRLPLLRTLRPTRTLEEIVPHYQLNETAV